MFGVYVHIPFCASRCDYCAFATWSDRDALMARYAAACRREVQSGRDDGGDGVRDGVSVMREATSVFFGGGTPSRLPAALLVSILAGLPLALGAKSRSNAILRT